MANTTLTADIIAKAAVAILDNELFMAKKVFRGYEEEFSKNINGYEVGDSVSYRSHGHVEDEPGLQLVAKQ